MRASLILLLLLLTTGCELNITAPSSTNTNTNTNTNNIDKTGSDIQPTTPTIPDSPIALPSYGESVTRAVATANPNLVINSCQDRFGESAWGFLDLVIRTLRFQDDRWGYLCKDQSCNQIARDIVAYKVTTGVWIVDVIGNHCAIPPDVSNVTWQVLPFESVRPWIGVRR